MWERWHAEIDLSLRDAELARDIWSDREFRAELRDDPGRALERFRLPSGLQSAMLAEDEVRHPLTWWERAMGWALPQHPAAGRVAPRGGRSI